MSRSFLRHIYLFLFFIVAPHAFYCQDNSGPVARFNFNNKTSKDEIGNLEAKVIGAGYTKDRFGNRQNAVLLYGNALSYVNLGSSMRLKPKAGSISLWVKLEGRVWSGRGIELNPLIITKNCESDDFFEAYNLDYNIVSKRAVAVCTQDSLDQISISSGDDFTLFEWHHLVMTYNNYSMAFYIDGKIEKKMPKHFETKFLENDSVVVGVMANKKNNRFSIGAFDDIEIYDRVLTDDEVTALYHAPNPNRNSVILHWVLVSLGVIVFLLLLYFYIKYRIRTALKREKQQWEQMNKSLENELRAHRALMNPHFIFNSLNGLQDFILKNANEEANDYLIKFSQLLRKILESNMSDSISVEMELDLLKRYIEIEGTRFEENISYSFTIDPAIVPAATFIPIMMLQPFVENAIWHGLLTKEGNKSIDISLSMHETQYIKCVINDNGIGRLKSKSHNSNKKSMAIMFVKQRLELLNKINKLHCRLYIEDKALDQGTIVTIYLPVLNG